jgi:hypothetical protein
MLSNTSTPLTATAVAHSLTLESVLSQRGQDTKSSVYLCSSRHRGEEQNRPLAVRLLPPPLALLWLSEPRPPGGVQRTKSCDVAPSLSLFEPVAGSVQKKERQQSWWELCGYDVK